MFHKYRINPLHVEALQWDGKLETARELVKLPGGQFIHYENTNQLDVVTPFGVGHLLVGWWVVKGPNGFFTVSLENFTALFAKDEAEHKAEYGPEHKAEPKAEPKAEHRK